MTSPETSEATENTDREIWREREGDFYADSIHVTAQGGIGINCGGYVIVLPIREWFAAVQRREPPPRDTDRESLAMLMMRHGFATGHGDTVADLIGELDAQLTESAAAAQVRAQAVRAHKTMTAEEYLALNLQGWHEVCWRYDGHGGVGVRYYTNGELPEVAAGIRKGE